MLKYTVDCIIFCIITKDEGKSIMAVSVKLKGMNGKVEDKLYGQFIELALNCINGGIHDPNSVYSDEEGIRKDVVEKAKELNPPVLRFPGGTIMCQYHWEDAIGPLEDRVVRKNLIWGGELDPSFGTAEFVSFCRKIGAEPMLCVNMASGTPEEAGNWVEYCNGVGNTYYANLRRKHGYEEPFQVKYWCIGNESYAESDIGVHHNVKLYIRDAWEFIKFMKLTDDSIKTVIVGCEKNDWNKQVLDALHPVTDYLSVHHYSGEGGKGIYGPFEGEKYLKEVLSEISGLLDTYPVEVTDFNTWYRFSPRKGKIKIALDEWNIWDFVNDKTYGLLPTYCFRDALWVASILNLLINTPSIGMANMAQMVNVIAPIVSEEKGSWFQTIAYPLRLYRNTMLGERIELSFTSPVIAINNIGEIDAISLAAVKNEDGTIRIAAVNRDLDKDYVIMPDDADIFVDKDVAMTVLFGDSPRAICSLDYNCVHENTETVTGDKILLRAGSINLITVG